MYNQSFGEKIQSARNILGPLFLILVCPFFAIFMWYTMSHLGGSIGAFALLVQKFGLFSTFFYIWKPIFFGSITAWKMIALFGCMQLLFMKILPGKSSLGPITPKGNVPIYKANGPFAFFLTISLFCIGSFGLDLFSAAIIYDHFGELLGALNIFSLLLCLFLYVKGRFFPSFSDSGITGNFIFDYYWGTELYPRCLGWDIKMFTNCRFGMMGWALDLISFAAKQHLTYGLSDSMLVAVAIQMLYITKFFFWEMGYMRSLDIMHDRAGFYICWGCLVWIPAVYTSPTLYLVSHPNHLGFFTALFILLTGSSFVLVNYLADRQRQQVRALGKNCKVWGKKPKLTIANYQTTEGEKKQTILLASGWWGISRHFHYVPEVMAAFFWTLPALFNHFLPYFYVLFLTILLVDRAFRDDKRCREKYGKDWERHCKKVPHKIFPFF